MDYDKTLPLHIMLTLISGTNRDHSKTFELSKYYVDILNTKNIDFQLLDLKNIHSLQRDASFIELEKQYLLPAKAFIFILPEYNAGIPGIFKLMMDNSDVRNCFNNKYAALVGLGSGRGGNLRGIDYTTNMCHYLKMHVYYNKLLLSNINELINANGAITSTQTQLDIQQQIEGYLQFIK